MKIQSDYLVIGSGVAGLYFAIKAAEHGSVTLVTKKEARESNTSYAQGGIASVTDGDDSAEMHVRDTLAAGAGLCDPAAVEVGVTEGPALVEELIDLGTRFSRMSGGELSLGREGGHSRARIVHADDLTGQEVSRALQATLASMPSVSIFDYHLAVDLIVDQTPRCRGVHALDTRTGRGVAFTAPVTLLATGGAGQIYASTTNPAVATGDGIAMAYRAGVTVGNMEFYQFHPTMLCHPRGNSFLISEALRGHGAQLVNHEGVAFVDSHHRLGSLATRDVVTRAIMEELSMSGRDCVYLDATAQDAEETRRRFPNIYRFCMDLDMDLTQQPIPVIPAAHYLCGGVRTDLFGRTDLAGLYAAGEVALTGFHGANRLASNSLLEALVFSRRAFETARRGDDGPVNPSFPAGDRQRMAGGESQARGKLTSEALAGLRHLVRHTTWEKVGIERTDAGLEQACQTLADVGQEIEQRFGDGEDLNEELVELRNMTAVAHLVAHSARLRKESRGGHFNSDHPVRDDANWQHDTLIKGGPLTTGATQ